MAPSNCFLCKDSYALKAFNAYCKISCKGTNEKEPYIIDQKYCEATAWLEKPCGLEGVSLHSLGGFAKKSDRKRRKGFCCTPKGFAKKSDRESNVAWKGFCCIFRGFAKKSDSCALGFRAGCVCT